MHVGIEKVANSLKGVASIIASMSEVPAGGIIWNEWALDLLNKELTESIEQLEKIACEIADNKQ